LKLKKIIQFFALLLIALTLNQSAYGQQKNLYHVPPLHSIKGKNLVISASLIDISNPLEAILYYRTTGSESFLEVPFKNQGFNWEATIPKFAITNVGLEYVITFRFSENLIISYPRVDPFNNPYYLQVIDDPSKGNGNLNLDEADILILSPDIGEIVESSEVFIAASFFYVDNLDMSSVRLFLDGQERTTEMLLEDDILTFDPESIKAGDHSIQIEMKNKDGDDLAPFRWGFTVGQKKLETNNLISYKGQLGSRLSSEKVSGVNLNVAEVQGKFDIDFDWAQIKTDARITSRENPYIQPQNRMGAQFTFSSFIDVNAG